MDFVTYQPLPGEHKSPPLPKGRGSTEAGKKFSVVAGPETARVGEVRLHVGHAQSGGGVSSEPPSQAFLNAASPSGPAASAGQVVAPAAANTRPEQGLLDAVNYSIRTYCKEKHPTKTRLDDYLSMSAQLSLVMSCADLNYFERWAVIGHDGGAHYACVALGNGNIHAAAALCLGILESGMPLRDKSAFVYECLDSMLKALKKQPAANQAWAQDVIGRINAVQRDIAHDEALASSIAVSLQGPPGSQPVSNCTAMHLSYNTSMHGGKIQCTASGAVPELEHPRYEPRNAPDGRRVYLVPHAELQPVGPYAPATQPRPESAFINSARLLVQACCDEYEPVMNVTKSRTYEAMGDQVRQVVGSQQLNFDEKLSFISSSIVKEHRARIALANGNLHAAVDVCLGIVRSGASLSEKKRLLRRGAFEVELFRSALREAPAQERAWADEVLREFDTLYAPVLLNAQMESSRTLALAGPPDSPQARSCMAMDLVYHRNLKGDIIECRATGRIPELEHNRYLPHTADGFRVYAIAQSELQIRTGNSAARSS